MLKIDFNLAEDQLIFFQKFKKDIVFKNNKMFINKKDKYLAERIIKKYKLNAKFENKKIPRKNLLVSLIFIVFVLANCLCVTIKDSAYKLNIECENIVLKKAIERHLNAYGKNINKENLDAIKINILENFENVGFVEIDIDKNKVNVSIIEVKTSNIEEIKQKAIYAKCDGIVSKIDLKSGTAKVKLGDVVKKGQILIDGIIQKNEEEKIDVYAKGEVYAKTYVKDSFKISKVQSMIVRTGNKERKIKWLFDLNKNCSFKMFDKKIEKLYLMPVQFTVETYYEKQMIKREISEKEIEEIALNEITQKIIQMSSYGKVLAYRYDQKSLDNFYHLDIYYEIEQCISIAGG